MKVPMGPPPPRNPNPTLENSNGEPPLAQHSQFSANQEGACAAESAVPESEANPSSSSETTGTGPEVKIVEKPSPSVSSSCSFGSQSDKLPVPYSIPTWSEPPGHPFLLEVLKDGIIIEQLDVSQKGAYMFGRVDLCDFVLEHPTISRFHAVLQFKKDEVLLYDLGSTHGTFVNKVQIKKKVYTAVHVGDVLRFGLSSRLYIFQGPTELMPPEGDLEKLRNAKIREEMLDCEASLVRARVDASLASGISWGLQEDAIEEDIEDGADEITWQTYNGQLTERQEKTRSKIIKRMEKVANMKKEIDAIRAKDIAQGGLTQGQQTQIGRNEQRISQIMEELENLEETLNESIQESVGARSRKVAHGTKNKNIEDEDEVLSDDDDFYDRTKKPSVRKPGGQQSVETVTADSLLERKVTIIKQIEEMKSLLLKEEEKEKEATTSEQSTEREDDLDLYMSGLSSQLVHDRIQKIQNELSDLQAELDKTTYLLKIADPMGEASRKRDLIAEAPKPKPTPSVPKPPKPEQKQGSLPSLPVGSVIEDSSITKQKEHTEATEITEDTNSSKPVYTALKPQWLGATRELPEENMVLETQLDENELDNFVDYGDRNKALKPVNSGSDIKGAASGLIIRKGKSVHETKAVGGINSEAEVSVSSDAEASAVDAIALLLKHKRGLSALEEEERESKKSKSRDRGKDSSKQKRVLGPSRPDFLGVKPEYEAWVPPEGQTGDGRTSLNDRLGY
ncbi:kanadaptin-like isoform X1 [Zingiber officinale]|uniref:kanadaptin-like isoform X1 n=2 Tax=Zingiber officinale TaxID=94328 RepID=UPI001C4BAB75|nr:kanadaptin-like isoform X1 [Zingiber officinale]